MTLNDLTTTNFQMSIAGVGEIAQGIADINQAIAIAILTRKGSDPFRPTFGSDLFDWIDAPLKVAAVNMKRAIVDTVEKWEKRVKLIKVSYYFQDADGETDGVLAGIRFNVTWGAVNDELQGELNLFVSDDPLNSPGQIIFNILATENGDILLTENGFAIQTN